MSPKTTISLVLLSLIATLTLSLAEDTHNDCPGKSVPEVLQHFKLPGGLMPKNVRDFHCKPNADNQEDLDLTVHLEGSCTVTRNFGVKNVLKCEPTVKATLSNHKLTNVHGITVVLYFLNEQFGDIMHICKVEVTPHPLWGQALQFFSPSLNSPKFPLFIFPQKPPSCDRPRFAVAHSDDSDSAPVVVPNWVYEYAPLLPFVAAN